ncbi:uncharacterized protein LOC143899634 [Temnothorax americanus]|uniref:uncharacterized protein LOC143899634 n=1 Tax=Temnothorax americanus TaxID=1964332 RepID=UPI0040681B06
MATEQDLQNRNSIIAGYKKYYRDNSRFAVISSTHLNLPHAMQFDAIRCVPISCQSLLLALSASSATKNATTAFTVHKKSTTLENTTRADHRNRGTLIIPGNLEGSGSERDPNRSTIISLAMHAFSIQRPVAL